MSTLSIDSLHVFGRSYGNLQGKIDARFGKQKIEIALTESEATEILAIALRIAQERQAALADEIRSAQPLQLSAPIEGEWTDAS